MVVAKPRGFVRRGVGTEIGRQPGHDPVDEAGGVPEVRVAALRDADQPAHVENPAVGDRVGGHQLGRPGVVPGAVLDEVAGAGDRPRIGGGGLVVVRVGVGIFDDAGHLDPDGAYLGRDAAPEVFGRDHLQLARSWAAVGGQSTSRNRQDGQRPDRDGAHRR